MLTTSLTKVLAATSKQLCRSTIEKNMVTRFGYNDNMVYHYALMMMVATIWELESFVEANQDPQWIEVINKEM